MAFQDYFSVVAFFVFLRETLEASVIIAVLLQCMNRTAPRLKKQGGPQPGISCVQSESKGAPGIWQQVTRAMGLAMLAQLSSLGCSQLVFLGVLVSEV